MRGLLISVVALTFCLSRAYPRIGDHPETKLRKEYGKGLPFPEQEKDPDERMGDEDEREEPDEREEADEREEPDIHRDVGDEPQVEGRVKETSVRRKHFMDQYYLQSGPVKYEFGHVCEDPDDWEHRYENRDFEKNSHRGQVKWGDANGGQGEHLWDFNHGGKDSKEEEEREEEASKEHRFQKPRKKIQIKEKILEKTTDGDGSREFRRSKAGTTVYSDHQKEKDDYKEVVTKTKKKKDDIPFLFDPVLFDSMETPRGFSKLDFEFNGHDHDFDHQDFDIDRMGLLAPDTKVDIRAVPLKSVVTVKTRKTKGSPVRSSNIQNSGTPGNRKRYVTIKEEVRRIDTIPMDSNGNNQDKKKKFSVEEHKEIRRYGFFPAPLLKRSLANVEVPKITSGKHLVPAEKKVPETKNATDGGIGNPITGSLTDNMTGKKYKIFGVLVDS